MNSEKILIEINVAGVNRSFDCIVPRTLSAKLLCRWFLGYGLLDHIPHFATVSYAFCQRFPDELTSEIFEQMLINSLRTYRMLEKYMNKQ